MKNAQPTIAYQYRKKNNINTPYLEKYVNNRDEILKDLAEELKVDKSDAKQMFIIVLNSGRREGIMNKFFRDFSKECEYIRREISLKIPDIKKSITCRKCNNVEATIMSIVLGDIEKNIFTICRSVFIKKGYCVDALKFDEAFVRKDADKPLTTDLINELSI